MSTDANSALVRLRKGQEHLNRLFASKEVPSPAQGFADVLRKVWSDAPVVYCHLDGTPEEDAFALDEKGNHKPQWATLLAPLVQRQREQIKSPLDWTTLRLPSEIRIQGTTCLANVRNSDHQLGMAAVVLPETGSEQEEANGQILADLCSRLGLHLALQRLQAREAALMLERAEQRVRLALVDVLSPVSHDLQNAFNALVLQSAVVARAVPEEAKEKIDTFRQLTLEASKTLATFDKHRHELRTHARSFSLEPILQEAKEHFQAQGRNAELEMEASLPTLQLPVPEVQRLICFLVECAVEATSFHAPEGTVTIRASAQPDKVIVEVEDEGPPLEEEKLQALFEPFAEAREGESGLLRSACGVLAKKLKGTLSARNRAKKKGIVVVLEMPLGTC